MILREGHHAKELTKWAKKHEPLIPELRWLHAIPNGGKRNRIIANIMKAEGVKAGVWDYFLPVVRESWPGLYIELKTEGREREPGGGLSDEQVKFGDFVREQGYHTVVAYGWVSARDSIMMYLGFLKS